MALKRIHVTGGPGAGKTTLAQRLGGLLGVPVYDQDGEALAVLARLSQADGIEYRDDPTPVIAQLHADVTAKMEAFAEQESWVSEGSSLVGADALFENASLVVMMDCNWRVSAYRIVLRHLKAELAHNNRFPGWRRMYRFCRYSVRYYRGRNPGLNFYGVPRNNYYLHDFMRRFEWKMVVCRTSNDVDVLIRRVTGPRVTHSWRAVSRLETWLAQSSARCLLA